MDNQLLRLSEARKYFFVNSPPTRTIRRWILVGINGVRLHAVVVEGKRPYYLISRRAVEEFFDQIAGESEVIYRKFDSREPERKAAAAAMERMRNRGWI